MGSPAGETPTSYPRPRRSGLSTWPLRIRRLSLCVANLSRRLRRAPFFASHKERGERNALKGTYAGAVPLRIPPRLPKGLRPFGRRGRCPRPYSPEYGAAPFGRCLKIPAKRPSQIETLRFDLKRRSHRAIRSFRSITVLRKRSERRALRRGSLWRFLSPISLAAKKSARRRRRDDGAKSRRKRRIRRRLEVSPLRRGREQDEGYFAPAGATFFRSAAKEGKDAPEGTYFEAVPSGLPPRRPRGLRPHWIPHFWTKDVRRGDGRVNGLPQPVCAPASQ